jgi:hypothetical protein
VHPDGTGGCPQGYPLNVSILSDGPETALGAHGGSGLSALGGVLRVHEVASDAPPIAHALKLELFAHQYYYGGLPPLQPATPTNGGRNQYVWPATGSDGYTWDDGNRLRYNGTNRHLAPGALLAIPADAHKALQLQTAPGARIAQALRDYGGYLVDDTASDSAAICMEAGCRQAFVSHYNLTVDTEGGVWYADLVHIFQALQIVTNNSPSSIGGGGTPIVPLSPPICN